MSLKSAARIRITIVACAVAAVTALIAQPATAAPAHDNGALQHGIDGTGTDAHPYLVYSPSSIRRDQAAPLVVVVHGCQTTAAQQMESTRYNRIADRHGFVVLYPDVDAIGRSLPWPMTNCWRFFDPASWHRGGGEAAAIASMTRSVMRSHTIDTRRVYLIGMSAGGFMASIMSATYPDLYAAIGIASAGAYADPSCLYGSPVTRPVDDSARAAYLEMGSRGRVVPRLVIGGDQDQTVPPDCQARALDQGLMTDNLVLARAGRKPVSLVPTSIHQHLVPHGHSSTVFDYVDQKGCLLGQRWVVHGMNHYWSGGSPDRRLAQWTDPEGPDAAEISWDFFARQAASVGSQCL